MNVEELPTKDQRQNVTDWIEFEDESNIIPFFGTKTRYSHKCLSIKFFQQGQAISDFYEYGLFYKPIAIKNW